MKHKILFFILILISVSYTQFKNQVKDEPSVQSILRNNNSNLIFGFFNPDNFVMRHSYNLSYLNYGNNGLAVGVYTNSMFYKISDPLNVQVDVSVMHSPYNSFGKQFQNELNGIYISKAALNWKPAENFLITVQYRNMPNNYLYNPFYSGYRNSNFWYDNDGFNDWYIGR